MAAVLVGRPAQAQPGSAPLPLSEDFTGSPVGQAPAGWQVTNGETAVESSDWRVEQTEGEAASEERERAVTTRMGLKSATFLQRGFQPTDGTVELEFLTLTHSATTRRGVGFGLSSGEPGPMTRRAAYLAFLGNGYLAAHDGISLKPVAPYRANTWYTVKVAVSPRLGGLMVWLNDKPVTRAPLPLTHGQPALDTVFFNNEGADPEAVTLADVSVRQAALEAPAPVTTRSMGGVVEVSWPAVRGAEGYTVYRNGQPVRSMSVPASGTEAVLSARDADAPAGRACSYTVTALRGEEESLPSWPVPALPGARVPSAPSAGRYDVVVYGGTPGGVAAALAAARRGSSVALLSHNGHVGGMISGGLGQTDLRLRQAASGIFKEFIGRVREFYRQAYGENSLQYRDCGGGYWIEPSVAETVLRQMLGEQGLISVAYYQRLDRVETAPLFRNRWARSRVTAVVARDTRAGSTARYTADTFVDASYEADLAAMAGAKYRVGREGRREHGEEYAGVIYWDWDSGRLVEGTTGEADNRVQAYNYRLTLTNRASNRVPIARPEGYDPAPYASIARDVAAGTVKAISQVIYFGKLPNDKYDINNMGRYWPSTDFIEENTAYPDASWEERDRIARAHRDWALGLLYYLQNDPALPEEFRRDALQWGLPADEHQETGNFPEQLYVREARRVLGRYLFTERDARSPDKDIRAPLHPDSVAVAEYPLDSHATRKRQPGHPNQLEGFFYLPFVTRPSQIPYGVLTPEGIDGLLVCVATSGTHIGNSTVRLEAIYMAMGEVCGTAAARNTQLRVPPHFAAARPLQDDLQSRQAQLGFFEDLTEESPAYTAMQFWATQGFFPSYKARPQEPVTRVMAAEWIFRFLARENRELWDRPGLGPGARDPNAARSERLGLRPAGEEATPDRTELPESETAAQRESELRAYAQALADLGVAPSAEGVLADGPLTWGEAALWVVRGKRVLGLWGAQTDLSPEQALEVLRDRGVLTAVFAPGETPATDASVTRGDLARLLHRARN